MCWAIKLRGVSLTDRNIRQMKRILKSGSVLLVEDDDLIRFTTTEMLSDIGCEVKEARTAHEALKILDEHPVDVLLTDVGLPGVSGLHLARDVFVLAGLICESFSQQVTAGCNLKPRNWAPYSS